MRDAIFSVGARNESRVLSLMSALAVNSMAVEALSFELSSIIEAARKRLY